MSRGADGGSRSAGGRAAAETMVDALVALHSIDPDEVGLGDLSRRGRYLDRQRKQWSTQWADRRHLDVTTGRRRPPLPRRP